MHRNQHYHVPPSLPQAPFIPQGRQQFVVVSPAPAPVMFPPNPFFAAIPAPAVVFRAPGGIAPQAAFFGGAPTPNPHLPPVHNHPPRGWGSF